MCLIIWVWGSGIYMFVGGMLHEVDVDVVLDHLLPCIEFSSFELTDWIHWLTRKHHGSLCHYPFPPALVYR